MPQTTILIPAYNCGKYILDTLTSVLNQSYVNYELLVIDDGSTDNSCEIIKSIADDRIVFLQNPKNVGIVKTLNRGIGLARGKYIARMDADDVMLGNRLQEQIDFLENNLDYGMVGGWYKVTDEEGETLDCLKTVLAHEDIKVGLIFTNQFAHSSVTMRTALAKQLKYKQDFIYTEDYDLWCRMAEITKVANLPLFHLSYRWYPNNTCNLKQKELKSTVVKILSRELDKYEVEHSTEELKIHAAICFGYRKRYFNSAERVQELNNWLDKVFSAPKVKALHHPFGILNCRHRVLSKIFL